MQNGSNDAEEVELLCRGETNDVQCVPEQTPLFAVVDAIDFASALVQVFIIFDTTVQQ